MTLSNFFGSASKRTFMLIFSIAAVLSLMWFSGAGAVGLVMGFGSASPTTMAIWEIIFWGVYTILVITVAFLFNKKGDTPFLAALITAVLPGILFWGWLGVTGYRGEKVEQIRQVEYEEFKREALALIPSTTEFLEARYSTELRGGNVVFAVELTANTAHDFDINILKNAFEFRIGDSKNKYYESRIVPNCTFFNRHIGIKPYTGSGNRRYEPGEHRISVEWWFYGPNCAKDNLRALLGKNLTIRSDSEMIKSFPIEQIESID